MEEKRNITISLKEAREWYKSNNKALREIALVYFQKTQDAKDAADLLGDELKLLF